MTKYLSASADTKGRFGDKLRRYWGNFEGDGGRVVARGSNPGWGRETRAKRTDAKRVNGQSELADNHRERIEAKQRTVITPPFGAKLILKTTRTAHRSWRAPM